MSADRDRDLMLFLDDELDQDRRTDVQARIRSDHDARRKLAAMRLVGDLVRESAMAQASAADDIAGSVMARIASEPAGEGEARRDKVVPIRRPAKDGEQDLGAARRIYAAAAIAVAVAAGLMIWGKVDATPPTARPATTSPGEVAAPSPTPAPAPPPAAEDAPSPDREVEMGVEIAAVDFGASHGSVFYVTGDAAGTGRTTAVVWITDDVAGGEP